MSENKIILNNIFIWLLTILGIIEEILPLFQLLAVLLAIAVSCISIYKFIKSEK